MRLRGFAGWVTAAAVLLLAGCGEGPAQPPASTHPGLPSVDISGFSDVSAELRWDESRFVLPLDRYMMTDAEFDRIDLATNVQMDRCMEDRGYDYWYSDIPPSEYLISVDRRYGIWNLDAASVDGYGLPESFVMVREELEESARQAYANRSEADDQAESECRESIEHLPVVQWGFQSDGEDERSLYLPAELSGQAYFLALEDPGAEEAFDDWAACLEENGLRRGEGPEQLGPADVPRELEAQIRVAVIDVTCKLETGFIERLSSLEAQYQAALIDQNQAALDASVRKQAEVLRRADEIIATHG